MALFRRFDPFLLFCRVQKAQLTANIILCRVPRSSTRQTLTLGSVNGAMTSPCAAPGHTSKKKVAMCWAVGTRRMLTALSCSKRPLTWSPFRRGLSGGYTAKSWFAVCQSWCTRRTLESPCAFYSPCVLFSAHGKISVHRVPEEKHTANMEAHGELAVSGSD